ncbi:MAG: MoaD/ThiS family protein [Chloroflexi bacterium]|nr:MoaD/ThiS family protein [Chloroflexota bacterium]
MITVKLLPPLARLVGAKQLQIEAAGNTVCEALEALAQQQPAFREAFFEEDGQPTSYYACRVNGEDILVKDGWDTILADGDVVVLLAPIAGGQELTSTPAVVYYCSDNRQQPCPVEFRGAQLCKSSSYFRTSASRYLTSPAPTAPCASGYSGR